ncbi:MAG TPA: hypothetical protein VFT12_10530, partial [Thermoanaerobaculia bacterium]|nr:hypothetical protein [Thermoanaerobaculia bacterium]
MLTIALVSLLVTAAPASRPCLSPEHARFNALIGTWEATTGENERAGTYRIERVAGGCGLLGSWHGASGITGTSLFAYDEANGKWQQVWIGSDGTLLNLTEGRSPSGPITMESTTD